MTYALRVNILTCGKVYVIVLLHLYKNNISIILCDEFWRLRRKNGNSQNWSWNHWKGSLFLIYWLFLPWLKQNAANVFVLQEFIWGFVQIKMKACNFKNVLILLPLLLSWVSLVCIVSIICHPCSILWSQVLHHAARLAALEMLHPLLSTCLLDDTWHCRFCVVLGVKGRVGHWAGPWEKMLN